MKKNSCEITYPLVMTAAVDPKGMSGLSVNDVKEREGQYLGTLKYYLDVHAVKKIVFVENSSWDLKEFRSLASNYPDTEIEFISCNLNDYPRELGKSYGEMLILDYVVDNSSFVREQGGFVKVTGRFPILNLGELLSEAADRMPLGMFCDCKNHKVYDILHLGWNGHFCDTRFFAVTTDFYRKYFYNRYNELDDSKGRLIENMFFQTVMPLRKTENVVCRFRTEPAYSGKPGHTKASVFGVNSYSSPKAKTKRAIRRVCRKLVPWFWF